MSEHVGDRKGSAPFKDGTIKYACYEVLKHAGPRGLTVRPRVLFPRARAFPRAVVRASREEDPAPAEELDFITRMVVKVFGQDALDDPEPMGLKRMSKEEWPDQWPALCDGSSADALPSDDTEELRLVRAVLKQTQLETMPLGIAYDASTHGWRASSFHTQCDGQGAAVLIHAARADEVVGEVRTNGTVYYGNTAPEPPGKNFRLEAKFQPLL